MEVDKREPSIRIVSGDAHEVEIELDVLIPTYAPMVWNFLTVGNYVRVTVVMIHARELRMAHLAGAAMMQPGGRRPN